MSCLLCPSESELSRPHQSSHQSQVFILIPWYCHRPKHRFAEKHMSYCVQSVKYLKATSNELFLSVTKWNVVFSARWSEILNVVSNLVDGWCESESSLSNSNSNQATKDDVEYIRFRPAQQCFFCFCSKTLRSALPLLRVITSLKNFSFPSRA